MEFGASRQTHLGSKNGRVSLPEDMRAVFELQQRSISKTYILQLDLISIYIAWPVVHIHHSSVISAN